VITRTEARRIGENVLSHYQRPEVVIEVIEQEGYWECHWDSTEYDPDKEGHTVPLGNPILFSKLDGSIIHVPHIMDVNRLTGERSSYVPDDPLRYGIRGPRFGGQSDRWQR
jgi:hypothetical protein